MAKSLSGCPVCNGVLHVSELSCTNCNTRIISQFDPCSFCALSAEQIQFVTLFLRNRGNISAVGDELDLSYPTVARRLDAIVTALDQKLGKIVPDVSTRPEATTPILDSKPESTEQAEVKNVNRREILDMLDRGEINAEEATKKLREL